MSPKLLYIAVGFQYRLLTVTSVQQFAEEAPKLLSRGSSDQVMQALYHSVGPHKVLFTESDATLLADLRKHDDLKDTYSVAFHNKVSVENVRALLTYLEEQNMSVIALFEYPVLEAS